MGISLTIKNANFADDAINVIVSTSQTSLQANHYYNDNGVEVSYTGITGIQLIEIPTGISRLFLKESSSNKEPNALNCFDENYNHIGLSGGSEVGASVALGTHHFYELPEGTKYISYINVNSVAAAPYNLGLALKWIGY